MAANWAKLKVVDLKAELKRRGLPQHGLKGELVARLEEADNEAQEEEAGEEQQEEDVEEEKHEEEEGDERVEDAPEEGAPGVEEDEPRDEEQAEPEHVDEDLQESGHVVQAVSEHAEDEEPQGSEHEDVQAVPEHADNETIRVLEQAVPEHVDEKTQTPEAPGSQKRKQRSPSPTPSFEDSSRKRARTETSQNGDGEQILPPAEEEEDYERNVRPAVHPATTALYISNLMRPLRSEDMQAHLADLASPGSPVDDVVLRFHIDAIRTHAFAVFRTSTAASRVRAALHDKVWPEESNRKALSVDYVPASQVDEWIATESSSGNARSGTRWEVAYTTGADGVHASLVECGAKPNEVTIPLGPRNNHPPTGPRAVRPGTGPGPRPPPGTAMERTRCNPMIYYQLVPPEVAQRRLANMRSFYTRDKYRDLGREINRYSFEDGDSFVDRGTEVFEGIRPPYRERAVERERRGGRGFRGRRGGGRGGPYPRSDRYLPAREDERRRYDDERPPRYNDRY